MIKPINSLKEAEEYFETFDDQSIVLFDIDNTLVTYPHAIMRDDNIHLRNKFFSFLREKYDSDLANKIWEYADARMILLEPEVLFKILNIAKGQTLAVTARRTGKPNKEVKSDVEEIILNILKDLGITFKNNLTSESEIILHEIDVDLVTKIENNLTNFDEPGKPKYKDGIIFTCNLNKGTILNFFLDKIKYNPSRIYFFDDKLKNLNEMMEYCKNQNIEFYGFQCLYYTKLGNDIPDNILNILSKQTHSIDELSEFNKFKDSLLGL